MTTGSRLMPGSDVPPRVVALLPAYNGAAFIERVLDALATQTYPNLGILISDDCSTDETPAICREFARKHDNVTFIRQPRNRGWVANSNELLNRADGEFMFFAFHDDEFSPTYVEDLAAALVEHPEAVLAYADILLATEDDRSEVMVFEPPSARGATSAFERARRLFNQTGPLWIAFRGLFRSRTARDVGGLQTHHYGERGADWLWLIGLNLRGSFVRVPATLYTKHKRSDGTAAGWRNYPSIRLVMLMRALREVMRSPLPLLQRIRLIGHVITCRLQRAIKLIQNGSGVSRAR